MLLLFLLSIDIEPVQDDSVIIEEQSLQKDNIIKVKNIARFTTFDKYLVPNRQ